MPGFGSGFSRSYSSIPPGADDPAAPAQAAPNTGATGVHPPPAGAPALSLGFENIQIVVSGDVRVTSAPGVVVRKV